MLETGDWRLVTSSTPMTLPQLDAHALLSQELPDGVGALAHAVAAGLVGGPADLEGGGVVVVDEHLGRLDRLSGEVGGLGVLGPDRRRQAVAGVVGHGDGLVEVLER